MRHRPIDRQVCQIWSGVLSNEGLDVLVGNAAARLATLRADEVAPDRGAHAAPLPHALMELVLDLSRLISQRVLPPTPTSVDRVEMAYARGLIARTPHGRRPETEVLRVLDRTERNWAERAAPASGALERQKDGRVYLQTSPHHLDRPERVAAILGREHARFVALVHDLISIDYPEYAQPSGADQHRRRIAIIAAYADSGGANSTAMLASITLWLTERTVARRVSPLNTDDFLRCDDPPAQLDAPYFLSIGTIEPHKSHLPLLDLWRRFADEGGTAPRLVLVGRRSWENENVTDMLERCPGLAPHVEERGTVPDRTVRQRIRGARPAAAGLGGGLWHASGGSAVMDAPVICSNLPALHEADGEASNYPNPLDEPARARAIRGYAMEGSLRRAAQIARMAGWKPSCRA